MRVGSWGRLKSRPSQQCFLPRLPGNTFLASPGSFVMFLSLISDHGSPSLEWLRSQGRLSVQWKRQCYESDPS